MTPKRPRLLVVDDDHAILTLIATIAQTEGFDVTTTDQGTQAMILLRDQPADLVLLDLRMPGVSGLDVLRAIRAINTRCRVVLMSGYATIDSAVEAVKLGATDYLTKPFDLQRLRELFAAVRTDAEQRRVVLTLEGDLAERLEFCGMVGRGARMQGVFELIRRLAPHARTALITGDTGTGKELAARALHKLGPRNGRPFVTVNCSAVVETLFESELFGHVRGAFTGASEAKAGLFETADGGTIFLDEVGELPLTVQAKLLRVLENGEVQRVGAVEPRKVDVRLIAATNRNLRAAVAAGRFRADLYYRLNIAEITLPPLRARREDIPYLTAAFVRQFARRFDKPVAGLSPGAERLLAEASWEGNVRQLRNVLERACMLGDSEFITEAELVGLLDPPSGAALPPGAASSVDGVWSAPETQSLTEDIGHPPISGFASADTDRSRGALPLEREQIVRMLEHAGGNKAVAARLLGISRRALYRQLERHGLHQSAEPDRTMGQMS